MNTFSELEFIAWMHRPDCNAWVEKNFDYYVLDYAGSGKLAFSMNEQPFRIIRGPAVWLTFPGPNFRFGRKNGSWNHRFVSFRGETAKHFSKIGLFPVNEPVIEISDPERYSAAFDQLIEYLNNPVYGLERAVHMLSGLLLQLHEQRISQRETNNIDPRIVSVIKQIRKAPELDWNLPRVATGCGISYPHFRRLFRLATGMPPGEFIIEARMKKAAGLLRQAGPPALKEAAMLCGYEDIYYFSKLFRKRYGLPPGRYRDNFQYI